jgi:hypothetical protein
MMFGTLTNKRIIDVISNNLIGRIGCNADGKTYVVPISYAYDGDYLYFRTFDGMKISMMRKNPNVCFQTDRMDDMADWESVIVWGTFEELSNEKERKNGLKILLSRVVPNVPSETVKFTSEWPFPPTSDLNKIDGIVFRVHIKEMTGRFEKLDTDIYRK